MHHGHAEHMHKAYFPMVGPYKLDKELGKGQTGESIQTAKWTAVFFLSNSFLRKALLSLVFTTKPVAKWQ